MTTKPLRILVFGAHPDDDEYLAGGLTALYTQMGHRVWLVSLTNGDAGHNEIAGAPLARRRKEEAAQAAACLGAESIVLDHHDGILLPTLEVRNQVISLIRQIKPDLVLAHRPNDYHPDHRYTGQVVQDAINMVIVGNLVPYDPPLRYIPVMMYMWDHFQKPYAFIPDVVVDIDDVYEKKVEALACHVSQVFEFIFHLPPEVKPDQKLEWLKGKIEEDMAMPARWYRQRLVETYGPERGGKIHYAEAFEVCEYGSPLSEEQRKLIFPF